MATTASTGIIISPLTPFESAMPPSQTTLPRGCRRGWRSTASGLRSTVTTEKPFPSTARLPSRLTGAYWRNRRRISDSTDRTITFWAWRKPITTCRRETTATFTRLKRCRSCPSCWQGIYRTTARRSISRPTGRTTCCGIWNTASIRPTSSRTKRPRTCSTRPLPGFTHRPMSSGAMKSAIPTSG